MFDETDEKETQTASKIQHCCAINFESFSKKFEEAESYQRYEEAESYSAVLQRLVSYESVD